jgi:glycosyltransferase involved in cell wall biosynthesis
LRLLGWRISWARPEGMSKTEFRGLSVENLAKYWRYCRIYGIRNATWLAIRRLQKPMGGRPAELTPLSLPRIADSEDLDFSIDKTVSVVIPTKNGSQYLEQLVGKLRAQRGTLPCEIVLVDSGSTDGTVAFAESEGVKVVQISPNEFTHSFSRNRGAEVTTGEYLLFMVQDALPLTNLWLWEMVTALETNQLAAVSCAEYPRADCDLFYGFLIQNHYNSARSDQDRILGWDESCASYLGLRSNAQISDVAALIRRDVFEKHRYRTAYAEDLDLGIRLIRDGHRLGFLHSTRVLHSHNRSAYYFFKRGYVDARFLTEVFPNFVFPQVEDKAKLFCDILMMWNRVGQVARELQDLRFPLPTRELTRRLLAIIAAPQTEPYLSPEGLDSELGELMQLLSEHRRTVRSQSSTKTNMIWPHMEDHCERLHEWICGVYDVADRKLAERIVTALEKVFALHSGTHLAYLYLTLRNDAKLDETLAALDSVMTAGV